MYEVIGQGYESTSHRIRDLEKKLLENNENSKKLDFKITILKKLVSKPTRLTKYETYKITQKWRLSKLKNTLYSVTFKIE